MYHPEIFDLEDAYLSGFWACEAYYADILPMLRSQIHFPDPEKGEGWDLEAAVKNKETMERMKQETSVSIHIRRGIIWMHRMQRCSAGSARMLIMKRRFRI